MKKTIEQIANVSFIFFIVFGLLHIAASFLVIQDVVDRTNWLIFNALDLPFLLAGLTYGASKLTLTLENITGQIKTPLIVCTSLAVVLFLIAIYLNFGIPDANLFQ